MVIYTIQSKVLVEEKMDRDGKKAGSSSGQYSNYTSLYTSLNQVLMQIKNDLSLKWSERIKGDPSKRNKIKYCHFHRDHGHHTDECYDLKQQIKAFIKKGKLKKNSWSRSQGQETANKEQSRRANTPTTWRNKDHCRRYINRKLIQSLEVLPVGSPEYANIWTTTKDDQRR